jgi:hypothetical protein
MREICRHGTWRPISVLALPPPGTAAPPLLLRRRARRDARTSISVSRARAASSGCAAPPQLLLRRRAEGELVRAGEEEGEMATGSPPAPDASEETGNTFLACLSPPMQNVCALSLLCWRGNWRCTVAQKKQKCIYILLLDST